MSAMIRLRRDYPPRHGAACRYCGAVNVPLRYNIALQPGWQWSCQDQDHCEARLRGRDSG